MARRRAQVDTFGDAPDRGQFARHFLGHQLAAQARLRALAYVYFQRIRFKHVVDVPAEPAGKALINQLLGLGPLLGQHAALAGILNDAGKARCTR